MKIGVPRGLFYHQYKPFVEGFFGELGIDVDFGAESGRKTLDIGNKHCVDEACLPIKVYHGHVKSLSDVCDYVAVPRLMKTEFGESICPKFCGLPELVSSSRQIEEKLILTEPVELNKAGSFEAMLQKNMSRFGVKRKNFDQAIAAGVREQERHAQGLDEEDYPYKVFLAGHPYNIYDKYINMNLIEKLHKLGIGVVTEERITRGEKEHELTTLLRKPYWIFFVNIYGAGRALIRKKKIDGILFVSSFSCGTDSFTIEMLRNSIGDVPGLVIKLDELSGEAGYDTRLEAFQTILESNQKRRLYS